MVPNGTSATAGSETNIRNSSDKSLPFLKERISILMSQCHQELGKQGIEQDRVECEIYLSLRYSKMDCTCWLSSQSSTTTGTLRRLLTTTGSSLLDCEIIVDDIRVSGIGESAQSFGLSINKMNNNQYFETGSNDRLPKRRPIDTTLLGPATVMDAKSAVAITVGDWRKWDAPPPTDCHQHQHKLQLDFSRALSGSDGELVANAPDIPAHLGSLSQAVKHYINFYEGHTTEDDVIMVGHPAVGRVHLPDLTIMTPILDKGEVRFFVASPGHHADIGGIN
ncbi:hypothetical protein EC968_008498 [Mortierella alpina]|nr:hypothetical protein EC968_008498 [Mortierella alpina]